jgi:hypothetical protein
MVAGGRGQASRGVGGSWLTDRSSKAVQGKAPVADDGEAADPLVANALRAAYEQAVDEDVPAEFLDLLSRLA